MQALSNKGSGREKNGRSSQKRKTAKKKNIHPTFLKKDVAAAFQAIEEFIILLSVEGNIVFINRMALSLYGWKYKNVIGKSFSSLIKKHKLPSPFPDKFSFKARDVYLKQTETNFDKLSKVVLWKVIPYKVNKKSDSFLLIGKDITDVKQLEEKIFELDTVISQIPGNLYWYSKDLIYLGCNANSAKTLKMTREETIGQNFKSLMRKVKTTDESLVDTFIAHGKEVLRTGKPLLGIEEPPFYGPDHKLRYYLANKVPLRNKKGEIYGVIGVSTDITYQKKLEKNLRAEREKALAASKSKSEFIANMSHDLRTPIAGMLGLVQNMINIAEQAKASLPKKTEKTSLVRFVPLFNNLIENVHQDSELLMTAIEELLQLCNEILEAIRLESKNVDEYPQSFHFREMIQHNLDLLKPVARHKNLKLIEEIDPKIPAYLIGLRNYLDRTLLNLLSNALKFTKTGWVKISAKLVEKPNKPFKKGDKVQIRISVEDSGIGIPKDRFATIFEHFSRLTPAYKGLYKGAGLGLYTVKQYVEAMKSAVEVKSKVGQGSSFSFTLLFTVSDHATQTKTSVRLSKPLTPVRPAIATAAKILYPPKIDGATILLVEDNAMAARAAGITLKAFNCVVDIADSGAQAILKARNNRYDLIVMDVGLPDCSGVEVTKKIRALTDKTKSQVPIVALTGHADNDEKRQECFEAGMQEVLIKPLQPLAFETVLQRLIFKKSGKTQQTTKTVPPIKSPSIQVIDWKACVGKCRGNLSLARELLSILYKDLKKTKTILDEAYQNKNFIVLRSLLHRLRGGVSYLKVPQLEQALAKLHEVIKAKPINTRALKKTYFSLQKTIEVFCEVWEKASF